MCKLIKSTGILVLLVCHSLLLTAQYGRISAIQRYLLGMDSSAVFKTALWGCIIENVKDEKQVAAIHAAKLLIPASIIKIAVTYPAYQILGPDFRFITHVEYDGSLHDSILKGNLYVRGGGDPTLGSDKFKFNPDSIFKSILGMLIHHGIKQIDGGIIADMTCFDDQPVAGGWLWEDIGNYYGSGVSGLNFGDNEYAVVFRPGEKVGEPAPVIGIQPPLDDLIIDNEVVTGEQDSGDGVIIYGGPYDNHRVYTGTVPLGKKEFAVKGSLPDPALNMVKQLHKFLSVNNIPVLFPATTSKILHKQGNRISDSRKPLGEVQSPPLLDILSRIHERSVNLYTDALLKMIGKNTGTGNDYQSGITAVLSFWKGKGVNISEINLEDGSGLSVLNRISPSLMNQMMKIIARESTNPTYFMTLNLAGETGDLKTLLSSGPCNKRFRGKSGYMKTVRAYTGIIQSETSEKFVFTIMVNHSGKNNPAIKNEIKKLMEVMCENTE